MFLKLRTFYTFSPNPLTEISFSGSIIDTVKYDIYINAYNEKKPSIPRHKELQNSLCNLILRACTTIPNNKKDYYFSCLYS